MHIKNLRAKAFLPIFALGCIASPTCPADNDGIPHDECVNVRKLVEPVYHSGLESKATEVLKHLKSEALAEAAEVTLIERLSNVGFFVDKTCTTGLCPILMLRKVGSTTVEVYEEYFIEKLLIYRDFPDEVDSNNRRLLTVQIAGLDDQKRARAIVLTESRKEDDLFGWDKFFNAAQVRVISTKVASLTSCEAPTHPKR